MNGDRGVKLYGSDLNLENERGEDMFSLDANPSATSALLFGAVSAVTVLSAQQSARRKLRDILPSATVHAAPVPALKTRYDAIIVGAGPSGSTAAYFMGKFINFLFGL